MHHYISKSLSLPRVALYSAGREYITVLHLLHRVVQSQHALRVCVAPDAASLMGSQYTSDNIFNI